MKKYDFKKAQQIIAENHREIKCAELGMYEDMCWTAIDVWTVGYDLPNEQQIMEAVHLEGSAWATPCIQLHYNDGSRRAIECFTGESDFVKPQSEIDDMHGVLAKPYQDAMPKLEKQITT